MDSIMKYSRWFYVSLLIVMSAPAFAVSGNVNLFLGQKNLNSSDWKPVEEQPEAGVLFDIRGDNWPVSIAVDVLGSADSYRDNKLGKHYRGSTYEFDVGVRKVLSNSESNFHPYVGGGLALVRAKIEETVSNQSVDDNSVGIWLDGGIYWTFARHYNLGLDLRYSRAKVSLIGGDAEAGGAHGGLVFGYHW